MLKNSRLKLMLESLQTRFRIGGFLVGDQIRFKDGIEKNEHFINITDEEKALLSDIIKMERDGDAIIKIIGLNTPNWGQGTPMASPDSFEIGVDGGGGQYLTKVTLPGPLISEIERIGGFDNINVPETIPRNRKITYDNNPPLVELTDEDEEGTDENAIPVKQKVHKLPTKNIKIGNKKTPTEIDYKKGIKSRMEVK